MIHFLNVDLLMEGAGLDSILQAWDDQIFILHRTRTEAVVELSWQPRTADAAILALSRMVKSLPPAERRRWDALRQRVFDAGFEHTTARKLKARGAQVRPDAAITLALGAPAVAAAAEVGAAIALTWYPQHRVRASGRAS